MKSIAVYNLKGGVGKTASSVNLAYLAMADGKKVLLWDLDSQGAASFYYQVKPKVKGGVKNLLKNTDQVEKFVKSTSFEGLDIIPADISSRNFDLILDELKKSEKKFASIFKNLSKHYDLMIVDAPPGFSLLIENLMDFADHVLIPLIPTTLSVRTYEQIIDFFDSKKYISKLMPFFTMFDMRKNMHKDIVGQLINHPMFLKSLIPYSSVVEKMGSKLAPLHTFDTKSKASLAYLSLWQEVCEKLSL